MENRKFKPVRLRRRHDGWTAEKQVEFIEALAESACVDEACRKVAMSRGSAYALRARRDAISFRLAWDAALDYAVRALSDAAFSRALNGVARPVYFQGEQIGERRYYNERLTMFLLRYRDPERYGAWHDRTFLEQRPLDYDAQRYADMLDRVESDAWADEFGQERPLRPYPSRPRVTDTQEWANRQRPAAQPPKSRGT